MGDGFKPIVVHGAGSFGHFQAKQYSVSSGTLSESGCPRSPNQKLSAFLREGFAKTRLSVTQLNHHIMTTMIQKGIPAVGVSPFPTMTTFNRQLQEEEKISESIQAALDLGLVPVLHGDACIDTSDRQTTILSGDTIFVHLCRKFKPDYAVFLADVDGVLTAPPGSVPEPRVIPTIFVDQLDGSTDIPDIEMSQAVHDVTGGIKHKLNAAIQVVHEMGIPVYIVKAGSEDARLAIRGEIPPGGTSVKPRE